MIDDFRRSRIERKACPSCEAVVVNGVYCHEAGCLDSHLFVTRECPGCGQLFEAEERGQRFCSDDCHES